MKHWPKLTAILRRLLLALAVVATLLALGIVVENWRGDRAWAAAERDLRARGEPLDLAAFQTPPIPDERNFFKAPVVGELLYAPPNDPANKKLLAETRLNNLASAFAGGPSPFGAKAGTFVITPNDPTGYLHAVQKRLFELKAIVAPLSEDHATDILAAMKPAEALLDAVVQAARDRPDAWLSSEAGPPFSSQQRQLNVQVALEFARVLAGRAKTRFALGQPDAAFADTKAILKFSAAINAATPTTLLSVLVVQAMRGTAADVLQEGCARHLWTEPQLAELQSLFAAHTPLAALRRAFQTERIWTAQMLDSPPPLVSGGTSSNPKRWPPWWLIRGWAQQNKVAVAKHVDLEIAAFDPAAGRIFPDRVEALAKYPASLKNSWSPYVWLVKSASGSYVSVIRNFGSHEATLRQAIVACALERHRLARGSYPATLAELAPAFLATMPTDVFTGQPFGYVRNPDGGFTLTATAADGHSVGKIWTQPGAR